MKKIPLSLNDTELFGTDKAPTYTESNNQRLLVLKFYFDNPERNQVNELVEFLVKDEEKAIGCLVYFESEGCSIRAAFLNPSHKNLSSKMGFRFHYHTHPYYKFVKNGSV